MDKGGGTIHTLYNYNLCSKSSVLCRDHFRAILKSVRE